MQNLAPISSFVPKLRCSLKKRSSSILLLRFLKFRPKLRCSPKKKEKGLLRARNTHNPLFGKTKAAPRDRDLADKR